MTWLWVMIALSIISMISIYWLRNMMSPLGIISNYMFAYIAITITGLTINMNLKLTLTPEKELVFWTQKFAEVFPKTILVVWLIAIVFYSTSIFKKILWTIFVISTLNGFELLFKEIGYLKFLNWNMVYSSLRYILIIILTIIYYYFMKKFREKEMVFK